jgi:hypothetical protein
MKTILFILQALAIGALMSACADQDQSQRSAGVHQNSEWSAQEHGQAPLQGNNTQ